MLAEVDWGEAGRFAERALERDSAAWNDGAIAERTIE